MGQVQGGLRHPGEASLRGGGREDSEHKGCLNINISILYPELYPQDLFQEFRGISLHGQPQQSGRPWIGLEHTNKVGTFSKYYRIVYIN